MTLEISHFITPEECNQLIMLYSSRRSLSLCEKSPQKVQIRKDNFLVEKILKKISETLSIPQENLELPIIKKYEKNKLYKPECEWINNKKHGKRLKTFLIYLNDDPEVNSGLTYLSKLFKTEKGKAVVLDLKKGINYINSVSSKINRYVFLITVREKNYVDHKTKRLLNDGKLGLPLNYKEKQNFLSKKTCNEIIEWFDNDGQRIEKGLPLLRQGPTINFITKESQVSNYRKAKDLGFRKNGPVAKKWGLPRLLKKLLKIKDIQFCENWLFIKYTEGGEYKEHPDYVEEDLPYAEDDKKKYGGLRLKTVLIYLNDDFEGGETSFPWIDLKIKPKKGKLVVFDNVLSNLEKNMYTIHAGLPVKKGTKYVILTWLREEKRP